MLDENHIADPAGLELAKQMAKHKVLRSEPHAMASIKDILEPFSDAQRLRMLKWVVCEALGWSGVRFRRTTATLTETPTGEEA